LQFYESSSPSGAGTVAGLLSDLATATKIAKVAKLCHLSVRNTDKADTMIGFLSEQRAALLILDWDGCETECYKLLENLRNSGIHPKMSVVGYLSSGKRDLKDAAQSAGCDRVYFKTDFLKNLESLIARCAL